MILPTKYFSLLILLCLTSCASIVTGPSDEVLITSTPAGAEFTTNAGHQGHTPSTITISDELTLQVQMRLEGYESATAALPPRMSGWFLGNIFLGGLVGMALDLISGNYLVHDSELNVVLIPLQLPQP
jgi:hypothetical protein